MAHSIPDGVNMGQLLAALTQMGITISAEQAAHLNGLGGGYLIPVVTAITISAPNTAPVSIPVVVIDDSDSDDDGPHYPSDKGSESDEDGPLIDTVSVSDESEAGFPTTGNTHSDDAAADTRTLGLDNTATDTADTTSEDEGEDDELRPGAYLKCTVCGTKFDLKRRKSGQPWQSSYEREAAEIGGGLPYSIAIM